METANSLLIKYLTHYPTKTSFEIELVNPLMSECYDIEYYRYYYYLTLNNKVLRAP